MKSHKTTILDCTFRDGGYYNNWQFDKEVAAASIKSLNKAGVDIIEVGFKTPPSKKTKSFGGLFLYCNESQLDFLNKEDKADYCFMINTQDFFVDGQLDLSLINTCIKKAENSIFSWVRIATHFPTFSETTELAKTLKGLGYNVGVNLMGISLLKEDQVISALKQIPETDVDVFYFADSFGNLEQVKVKQYIKLIRKYFKGEVGIHTHNNQGMAFANTLSALEEDVDFIDSTIMGMGRGAGNLRTEHILPYLYFNHGLDLNPSALLEVIDKYWGDLFKKYQWGWNYAFMLGSLKNIHPIYCQNLQTANQYSMEQISNILNDIEPEKRTKHDEKALSRAIDSAVNRPLTSSEQLQEIPLFTPPKNQSVLVIATAPCKHKYKSEIETFIQQHQPLVIECNPVELNFETIADQYFKAILNWVRLKNILEEENLSTAPIITGLSAIPSSYASKADLRHIPVHINQQQVEIARDSINIPAYVVGMFSIGLATLSTAKTIYIAGFDGYQDQSNPKHQEMKRFWEKYNSDKKIISLTPSTYPIEVQSIYSFIK